ncbi:class I SAM-dependent methyltransferase, partial [Patescibacteria group bacterium]|nr:class I SAM-dependent methyltransferase [Patescibacteria group bacterium]
MMSDYGCLGADYRRIESRFERWAVHKTLGLFFGNIPVELDFLDGDVRQLRHNSPSISVAPPKFWRLVLILRNPYLYFPQAFVNGYWFCVRGSLAELVLQLRNRKKKNTRNSGFSFSIGKTFKHVYKQYIQPPKIRQTKKHYNEDFRIYEQVIGKCLVYSCAFFEDFSSDLSTAQEHKLKIILDRIGGE